MEGGRSSNLVARTLIPNMQTLTTQSQFWKGKPIRVEFRTPRLVASTKTLFPPPDVQLWRRTLCSVLCAALDATRFFKRQKIDDAPLAQQNVQILICWEISGIHTAKTSISHDSPTLYASRVLA